VLTLPTARLHATLLAVLLVALAALPARAQTPGEVLSFERIGGVFGQNPAGLGDVDGDGVPDVISGDTSNDNNPDDNLRGAGAAYIAFLNADGTVKAQQKISNGTGGLPAGALFPGGRFGSSAARIEDLDDDGVPEVIVGASLSDLNEGAAYVLFLNGEQVNPSDPAPGTVKRFVKIGDGTTGGLSAGTLSPNDQFGSNVAGLGDVDGDGVPDVLVGAPEDDDGASGAGAAYVLFLNADGTMKAQQKISNGNGGLPAGTLADDAFGSSAAGIGDLDGDAVPDVLVGAPDTDDGGLRAGAAYMLFLNADGTVKARQKISDGTGGLPAGTIARLDEFGESAAGLGDLDGDGIPDVLVGAPGTNDGETRAGAAYVLFLNSDGMVKAQQKISNGNGGLPAGTLGPLNGFGRSAARLGDLDGDGVLELEVIVSSYLLSLSGSTGATVTGPGLVSFGASGVSIDFAAGTSGSGTVAVTRFADPPTGTTGIPAGDNVSSYRIVITADAGLTVGSGTQVRFDVSAFGGITAPGGVTVYSRPDVGTGTFAALPTSVETSGGVTELVATVDGFSEFVFVSATNPLPVELAAFTATADGPDAVLTWQTLGETNNAGFAVETRAMGGAVGDEAGAWREVGFVDGAGTTTEPRSYTFRARQVGYGTHAFRLRQVDFDGTPTRSNEVELTVGLDAPYAVAAYPNPLPAGTAATVDVAVRTAQDVTVALYDVLGRRVRTLHDGPLPAQETTALRLAAGGLASGVYLVRVTGERFQTTRRVTIVR
jgi:hypothetical protein